jgi:hypothetical protein
MDFIPVDPKLPRHPKIRALSRLLSTRSLDVWPRVIFLWMEAFEFYPDGDVTNLENDEEELARIFQLRGNKGVEFFKAMIDVGLIDRDEDRLLLHDWNQDGCGRMIKHKEKANQRWRKWKEKKNQVENDDETNVGANVCSNVGTNVDANVSANVSANVGQTVCQTDDMTRHDSVNININSLSAYAIRKPENDPGSIFEFEKQNEKNKNEKQEPATLDEILSAGEKKFTAKQKAEAIYDSWKKKNNAHDRDRAIKNIVTLLTKEKVPFHKLLAAFDNYTRQEDKKGSEAQFRKTCANFFGRDRTWTTYADEIPQNPKTTAPGSNGNVDFPESDDPIFNAIIQNLSKFKTWVATGGITKSRETIVDQFGEDVFNVALAMSREGWFKRWNDLGGDSQMVERIICKQLPGAYQQAKSKIEKATEKANG